MSHAKRFLEAAAIVEQAADAVGTEAELVSTMKALRYMEEIEIAMLNRELNRQACTASRQKECLPLRDEGDDFARVEARIPKKVAFAFMKQRNFGLDGMFSDEGMKDLLKAFPQWGVKTVSGKTVFGFTGKEEGRRKKEERKQGAVFGRGTLVLAD